MPAQTSDAVLPLHKLHERVLKLKSKLSEYNNPPALRSPIRFGALASHRTRSAGDFAERTAASLLPPPLKVRMPSPRLAPPVAVDDGVAERENFKLRSILRDNLAEQSKIQSSLDLLRTELLARASKINAMTTQIRDLKIFRDVTLPEMEVALVEKDLELENFRKKREARTGVPVKPSFRLGMEQTRPHASFSGQISDNERVLKDINAKLEISVSSVLTRVCRSVACGIISTIADSGQKTQNFLCIFLKTVELFEEPDDANPKICMQLRSCKVSVNTKSLALNFADAEDAFTVANDGKPEKLEKWLVALRGLRISVDYLN